MSDLIGWIFAVAVAAAVAWVVVTGLNAATTPEAKAKVEATIEHYRGE